MIDLTTNYLGLALKNPLVPSPSPLMRHLDNLKRMEDAGAAAVVLHSLFEEQITRELDAFDFVMSHGTESFAEALTYFPEMTQYNLGLDGYLEHIQHAKSALSIPVIASLNGYSSGGWVDYARQIQSAGADALELNMYYIAADLHQDAATVEDMYLELVREIRRVVHIPLAVKLGHHFTAFANFADQLARVGADALVLFNRFYQPDLDLESLEIVPSLNLSSSYELRLRLRWIGLLYGRVACDLAVTGGVHTAEDVLKSMMAGANIAMMTSALLHEGIDHLTPVLTNIRQWMTDHEYESIQQMRGSMSYKNVAHPAAFERANYVQVLRAYEPTRQTQLTR